MCPTRRQFLYAGASLAALAENASSPQTKSLKITLLSNQVVETAGTGEWGFSALVEADGRRMLFDTGARPDTVLNNARELRIDWSGVDTLIISHSHGDHNGGVRTLRSSLKAAEPKIISKAYVAEGMLYSRPGPGGRESNPVLRFQEDYVRDGCQFVQVSKPAMIGPGLWLTGPIPRVHPERNWSGSAQVQTPEGLVEDTIPEDMALVCDTAQGLVVLSGCGHAGIVNTLEYARKAIRPAPIHAAAGGWHTFTLSPDRLDWTAAQLKKMPVQHFLGAHCTGVEATLHLRQALGLDARRAPIGTVGMRFELGQGIQPHRVWL